MKKEWFADWFDSPYYHLLYANRDFTEASAFVEKLVGVLKLGSGHRVLDLACGKGRHSIHLARSGAEVVGVDLSYESISAALEFEGANLSFYTHDMRRAFRINYFDFVLNLFTSFGYFDTLSEHIVTLKNIHKALKPKGMLLIDFLNVHYVAAHLVAREEIARGGIRFLIRREMDRNWIRKKIEFLDGEKQLHVYEERVRAFCLSDFEQMLEDANFSVVRTYGDYRLGAFDPSSSPRLILLAKKEY